jgi:hypothetical protein
VNVVTAQHTDHECIGEPVSTDAAVFFIIVEPESQKSEVSAKKGK